MKARNGFVSNSSSSSFVIFNYNLSDYQLNAIENHTTGYNKWIIKVSTFKVVGYTSMDNFNMVEFLEGIGVPSNKIKWDY